MLPYHFATRPPAHPAEDSSSQDATQMFYRSLTLVCHFFILPHNTTIMNQPMCELYHDVRELRSRRPFAKRKALRITLYSF